MPFASLLLHLIGAAGCAAAAIWLARQPLTRRSDRSATMAALFLTALWSGIVAACGQATLIAHLAESCRNLAWLLVMYRLFAQDGRDRSVTAIRPLIMALSFLELVQPGLAVLSFRWAPTPDIAAAVTQVAVLFRILTAIGALVLLHNLYGTAARESRDALGWSAAALGALWLFDLNHYVVQHLQGSPAAGIAAIRGIVAALIAVPIVIGASNGAAGRKLQASHRVAFQTVSLLLIGAYLLVMLGAAQFVSLLGGDIGRIAQTAFLVAAGTASLLWLPSKRLRGYVRVTVLKHLFQHRYDYREEWMRFNRTISRGSGGAGQPGSGLHQRALQAIAEIVQSPAAVLYLPGDDGILREATGWNWHGDDEVLPPLPSDLVSMMERKDFIVQIDTCRSGSDADAPSLPEGLLQHGDAWLLVPLLHFDRVIGVVLLARPPYVRPVDWEDFDLLKVVARQLASYLAEHENHRALLESAQFDDFNRRIAFVMHDIKNLASQLSLLARNAERHAENPEFRKDMLVTLRSSSDKLNTLLARLGRYGTSAASSRQPVTMRTLGRSVLARFSDHQCVALTRVDDCEILADPEGIEQAIIHLVQNAIDASEPGLPVCIDMSSDGLLGRIEIIDSGCGMDAEFVRHRLFKPFVSSKDGGFGIGALEARELIRSMGGRLDVQSRPGIGTRFTITIPLVEAARLLENNAGQEAA